MLPVTEIILPQLASNVPAFLAKLWKMVDDPDTDHLISWGDLGNSFVIHNQAEFSQSLLPYYYKHSNMASFVRQLNMYGFHKVVGVDSGGLKSEKDNEMEFAHPFFLRGQEILLANIKRKVANSKPASAASAPQASGSNSAGFVPSIKTERVTEVLSEVSQLKDKQEDMDSKLETMKKENEALWREVINLRQKHSNQQKIVNKLIHFLMGCLQGGIQHPGHAVKRRYQNHPLAIESRGGGKQARFDPSSTADQASSSSSSTASATVASEALGPVIFDVTYDESNNEHLNNPDNETDIHISEPPATPKQTPQSPLSQAMAMIDPKLVNPSISLQQGDQDNAGGGAPRPTLKREISREDFDSETFQMQKEIDNLKDILSGQITLDSSLISSLFNPNEPLLFPKEMMDEQQASTAAPKYLEMDPMLDQQQPSLFELADIDDGTDDFLQPPSSSIGGSNNGSEKKQDSYPSLETPLITEDVMDTNPLLAQITSSTNKRTSGRKNK